MSVLPLVPISYQGLTYSIHQSAREEAREEDTIGSKLLDIVSLPYKILSNLFHFVRGENIGPETKEFRILDNIDGIIKPGTMTLLLSPPGHGKSCFLKALAQLLVAPPETKSGVIKYGGLTPMEAEEKGIQLGHLVQYIDQLDQHFPFLTVKETFQFIHDNATVPPTAEFGQTAVNSYSNRVNEVIQMLKLQNCADTLVGDNVIRGISGGEKKRVTIGEGLLTNARVLLMDEISTGLDSSVTFEILSSLQSRVKANSLSVVVALLQPTPEVYRLFDEVMLMREGAIIYHGLRSELPTYLSSVGYKLPEFHLDGKMDEADFLSELLSKPFLFSEAKVAPTSTSEMVSCWKKSAQYSSICEEISTQRATLSLDSEFNLAQYGKNHVHSVYDHVISLLKRQFLIMSRNKVFLGIRVFGSLFISFIVGGMYWQKDTLSAFPFFGLFTNMLMNLAFSNLPELSTVFESKFIAYKHCANKLYPPFSFVLVGVIAQIPMAIVESIVFCAVMYFMSGLVLEAGRFFFFLLCGFLSTVFMANLLRSTAFAFPTLSQAQSVPMIFIFTFVIYAGFMITPDHMGWLKFIYYIDIFAWLYRAVAQNEFLSDRYNFYVNGNSLTLGESYLATFGISIDPSYMWWGILFSVCSIVLSVVLSFWTFKNNRFDRNVGSVRRLMEEDLDVTSLKQKGVLELRYISQIKSSIQFDPMIVVFKDIKYTVDLEQHMGGGKKTLLNGITGYALPGRMIALMGASGAGKTTLLDVLACRKNSGVVEGCILLNGFPKHDDTFSRVTAYVEQQDLHMPLCTVKEALYFSSELRLPEHITISEREAFINEIMTILELSEVANRRIGELGSSDGLSPGERKRVTIAVELVSNAPVLFLDEPTSGLDARSAAIVMRVVKRIANTGRTVICTIHQPSADVFSLFDDLLLLQCGGFMVYFGPINEGEFKMTDYLQSLPNVSACPEMMNSASWMLDALSGSDSSDASAPKSLVVVDSSIHISEVELIESKSAPLDGKTLMESLFNSKLWAESINLINKYSCPSPNTIPVSFSSKRARSFLEQFYILLIRQVTIYWRHVPLNFGRFITFLIINFMFGIIYFQIDSDDVSGVSSLVAGMFMVSYVSAMINMQSPTPDLLKNRAIFYREQKAYMYNSYAYSFAYICVEFPTIVVLVLATRPISTFMMGLNQEYDVWFFQYLVVLALSMVFGGMGYFFSTIMPSYEVAQAVQSRVSSILMLFGGLFAPVGSMPAGTQWFTFINPITYAFKAIIPVQFACEGSSCSQIYVPTKNMFQNKYTYVSDTYDVYESKRWNNLGYVCLFLLAFQTLAFVSARYKRLVTR